MSVTEENTVIGCKTVNKMLEQNLVLLGMDISHLIPKEWCVSLLFQQMNCFASFSKLENKANPERIISDFVQLLFINFICRLEQRPMVCVNKFLETSWLSGLEVSLKSYALGICRKQMDALWFSKLWTSFYIEYQK